MDKYYSIYCDADGDITIKVQNKEELEEDINDEGADYRFVSHISGSEPKYWQGGALLIIKGKIIVPKEKKIVVKLVLE